MNRIKHCALFLALVLTLAACGSSPSAQPTPEPAPTVTATPTPAPTAPTQEPATAPSPAPGGLSGAFAMLDASGTKLILLPGNSGPMVVSPEALDTALCSGSTTLPVRYLGYQDGDPDAWDGRATVYGFDNMSGHLYEIDGSSLDPNLPCFLTSDAALSDNLIPLTYQYADEYWLVEADAQSVADAEARQGLAVTYSAQLAVVADGVGINLFRYERVGDDMLFDIIYRSGDQFITVEFPAPYYEPGTWRAGIDDHPGMWDILFLVQTDAWSWPPSGPARRAAIWTSGAKPTANGSVPNSSAHICTGSKHKNIPAAQVTAQVQ